MARVLYVDDDYYLAQGVQDILKISGYEARIAINGQAALDVLNDGFLPDIIVCNIMMPHMDGYEFFRRVKQHDHLRTLPFIFSSALSEPDTRSAELGADAFLQTPFDADDLLTLIQTHLRHPHPRG